MDLLDRLRQYAVDMREEVRQRDIGEVPMDKYRDEMANAALLADEAADELERRRNA